MAVLAENKLPERDFNAVRIPFCSEHNLSAMDAAVRVCY